MVLLTFFLRPFTDDSIIRRLSSLDDCDAFPKCTLASYLARSRSGKERENIALNGTIKIISKRMENIQKMRVIGSGSGTTIQIACDLFKLPHTCRQ